MRCLCGARVLHGRTVSLACRLAFFAAAAALSCQYAEASSCSIGLELARHDAGYNGHPRNNPDGTLYPGDAFDYSAEYAFSRHCISPRITIEASGSLYDAQGERTVRAGRAGSIGGTAEILIRESLECLDSQSIGCGSLTATAHARELHCGALHSVCWYELHEERRIITPRIIEPRISIILGIVPLLDADGYAALNLDKTSYPQDPIAVRHEADFAWKNERHGTIKFEYERSFSPLAEGGGFECARKCVMPLEQSEHHIGIDFLPGNYSAGSGGGMYVYAARAGDAAVHGIEYSITVLNLGREIAAGKSAIEHRVVPYNPAYEHYAYPVFRDGGDTAYDNRHGVALYYLGSYENDALHADRRSKISGFSSSTHAASDGGSAQTRLNSNLQWSSADAIGGSSFLSLGEHAMFESAGYGVIRFYQNVSAELAGADKSEWYDNVTVRGILNSDSWAGGNHAVLEYSYRYPNAGLASWFNVTVLHDTAEAADISVNSTAVPGPGVVPLDEYLASKAVHDTGREAFADIAVSDLYRMENFAQGVGAVSMKTNKTHLEFPGILLESADNVMDIPLHESLSLSSRMRFAVGVGGMQRDIVLPFEFGAGYHEAANIGSENKVWYKRTGPGQDGSEIIFRTDASFGVTSRAEISGVGTAYLYDDCSAGCTIYVGQNPANVTIYNAWNGTASLQVQDIVRDENAREPAFHLPADAAILIISSALAALLARAVLGRIMAS